MGQLLLLLRLYVSPLKSFSRILDEGRLLFAAVAAVAVLMTMQVPRPADQGRNLPAAWQVLHDHMAKTGELPPDGMVTPEQMQRAGEEMMAEAARRDRSVQAAAERFTGADPSKLFSPLLALAICIVPMIIVVMTFWDHLGGLTTVLFRDYVALLICCLMAWTAAYLLLMLTNFGLGVAQVAAHDQPALWWMASAYCAALTAIGVRTVFGTSLGRAAGATGAGWIAGVAGVWLFGELGNVTAYLASPFLLYYLYIAFGSRVSGLGVELQSRQRFKKMLETATVNPRDADAHTQLGLIYVQRRQYELAAERFRKAIEVDPDEAEAHYQLARIERHQGKYAEAVEHCRAAVRIDDKHSSSEVWREMGASMFLAGDAKGALAALDKYCERHEYDPEGAIWRGRALAQLGRGEEARPAFQQAIEAVRTMPKARRRQVAKWEGEARRELKKL